MGSVLSILRKYQEWVYSKDEELDFPITPSEVAFLLKELGDTYKKEEIEKKYRRWVCGMVVPDEFPVTRGDVHYLFVFVLWGRSP